MLPFIYTHLVSALSTFYLMVTAFLIGLYFQPGEPVVFTMCLSIIGLFVAILSTFGLLEVGSTILDPFGEDPEDFALTHFVEYSMGVSREAIEIRPCTVRGAHADFYSPDEIASACLAERRLALTTTSFQGLKVKDCVWGQLHRIHKKARLGFNW